MKTCSTILFLLCFHVINAQAPDIEWQNTIGGGKEDIASWVEPAIDGGYIVGGTSESESSADKSENNLGTDTYPEDYWIVKLDTAGNIEWENTLGGERHDWFSALAESPDGTILVGGESTSEMSDDKSEDGCGGPDMWIVKLAPDGSTIWDNSIGGLNYDYLYSFMRTTDGGYILGGNSASDSTCDKTIDHYGYWDPHDYWVVKIDAFGIIEWQTVLGGEETDGMRNIIQTSDGGYLLTGYTYSSATFDITEINHGYSDFWIVKLDASGNIEWENLIGGDSYDLPTTACETPEGDYFIGGYSISDSSGDKSEDAMGNYDFWIVKLDAGGNLIWENTIGTYGEDVLRTICPTFDGNYILGGYSTAEGIEVDKTVAGYGGADFWIIKMNSDGEFLWQNVIGGDADEGIRHIEQSDDYGYIIAGWSNSDISGLKTEDSQGDYDYWIVKLYPECPVMMFYADYDGDGYGNAELVMPACEAPEGYVTDNSDCNDSNAEVNPALPEICNMADDNCNGLEDEDLLFQTWYADADSDLFGNPADSTISCIEDLAGYVLNSMDCNDENAAVNPASAEICNLIDDECDGLVDNDLFYYTYFIDADGDGYGDLENDSSWCDEIDGYVLNYDDCNDDNAAIYPGAPELLNGEDDNCDGFADEGLTIENNLSASIQIYPNPATSQLHIESTKEIQTLIGIKDISGKSVHNSNGYGNMSIINVSEFSAGLYFLSVISGEDVILFRFVKD